MTRLSVAQQAALDRLRVARRVAGPVPGWRFSTLRALERAGLAWAWETPDGGWEATYIVTAADVAAAAERFRSLRDRRAHPDGSFDGASRWYPDREFGCCADIRQPTRSWPYSMLVHCRTAEHVAHECRVPAAGLLA